MLEEADRDGDGMLNFEEFYRIMRRRGDPLDDFDSDDEWFAILIISIRKMWNLVDSNKIIGTHIKASIILILGWVL